MSSYWLLDHGYDLFIFDYPGYGASLGSPTPENTVTAGKQALEYVRKTWPDLPLVIVGQSLGGAVALRTLIDETDRHPVCAIVTESSFDSYRKVAQEKMKSAWLLWPFQWLPYLLLSDRYAPTGRIHELSPIPLLIAHRRQDPVVPVVMSERLYAQAASPKELHLFEGSGHVDHFWGPLGKANQSILIDFFQKNCH